MSDNQNERTEKVPLDRDEILRAMSDTLTEIDNECTDLQYVTNDGHLALFVVQTTYRLALMRQYLVMLLDASGMKMVEAQDTPDDIPF